MSFAERVKLIKKERGITNDDLSTMTNIPLGTLSKILAGVTADPKLTAAAAIASALDTTLDFLSTGKTEPKPALSLYYNETIIIKKYRALDEHGKEICDFILSKEYDRIISALGFEEMPAARSPVIVQSTPGTPAFDKSHRRMTTLPQHRDANLSTASTSSMQKKLLPLYHLPVSAGSGVYLDGDDHDNISVIMDERTAAADFALRVRGDSMQPNYSDGDIVLVHNRENIGIGELGIFIADGEGYFKEFGGDCLISLNPKYDPLPLSAFDTISCRGKVIGRLKRHHPNA